MQQRAFLKVTLTVFTLGLFLYGCFGVKSPSSQNPFQLSVDDLRSETLWVGEEIMLHASQKGYTSYRWFINDIPLRHCDDKASCDLFVRTEGTIQLRVSAAHPEDGAQSVQQTFLVQSRTNQLLASQQP